MATRKHVFYTTISATKSFAQPQTIVTLRFYVGLRAVDTASPLAYRHRAIDVLNVYLDSLRQADDPAKMIAPFFQAMSTLNIPDFYECSIDDGTDMTTARVESIE